jgi:carboxymethylenebutenolidase
MPPRRKASDFDPQVLQLFDQYVHGLIDRRGFLTGAARFAVGASGAAALLAALAPQFAAAQQVKPDDKRLRAGFVEFDSPDGYGKGRGYLVRPADAKGPLPMVMVIHENRGLNPHIEDVTRRMALEDFIAFAPDALFPLGGYPGDEDAARAQFAKLDQARTRQDFLAAVRHLRTVPGNNGRLGATGFCWGGGMANFLASQLADLAAAAPFYGSAPPLEDVGRIRAEMLVVLAANDERINKEWPAYEAALKAADVKYSLFQPPGTQHGFHNDTTPRYDEDAAREAWRRTIALFERVLRGGAAGAPGGAPTGVGVTAAAGPGP